MARIRKDILDAIVTKTGYTRRHVRNLINYLIEKSGYVIPNQRVGANILASKMHIKINEILTPDELEEVRRYRLDPDIECIQIQFKGTKNKSKRITLMKKAPLIKDNNQQIVEENKRLQRIIKHLEIAIENLNPRIALDNMKIPPQMTRYIDKAFSRIEQGSYSEAIMNCYRVSERLVKILFDFLYPDQSIKRIKHEDKLKRIWNDEENEKKKYPGIRVIASLLAVVLWYRNKMGAHTEMEPTKEAARICIFSLIQSLIEFQRLGLIARTK